MQKEMEKNNRREKMKDLFKRTEDIKGKFHVRKGMIKDINGRDLIEAVDIKKRWQEYPEELHKKRLNDLENHDGVVTSLNEVQSLIEDLVSTIV